MSWRTELRERFGYIPVDLKDALRVLREEMPDADLATIMAWTENEVVGCCHHGLGRRLRNAWKLYIGSRLAKWFAVQHGIVHADDMSGIILTSLWRVMHDKPVEVEQQVRKYKEFWNAQGTKENA